MENVSTGGKEPVVETATEANSAADLSTIWSTGEPEIVLYVRGLAGSVTEEQLKRLFDKVGKVKSVKLCVDVVTEESLGYGYVNFSNPDDAAKAVKALNFSFVNGRQIRISFSNCWGSLGVVFFKHLYEGYDKKAVKVLFSNFGKVISYALELDSSGISKGCGYVKFVNVDSACSAAEHLNGKELHGKKLYVDRDLQKLKFTNVAVKNISEWMTEKDLITTFHKFGPIISVLVVRDGYGNSKCAGFVRFEKWQDASNSVEMLNGKAFYGREWTVKRALSGFERMSDNMRTVFVKNMKSKISDDELKKLFSPFGTITSCRIMRGHDGLSRGFGFIVFTTFKEAIEAISEMNGKKINGKPLVVSFARLKVDEEPPPQAHEMAQQIFFGRHPFTLPLQMRPIKMAPTVAPPRMQQIPPQPVYPNQQQQVPMQQAPRQVNKNLCAQMMVSRGHGYSHQQHEWNVPIGAIASPSTSRDNPYPDELRAMLGENLYPLVEALMGERKAAKLTGMLLDLGEKEVAQLLESPLALRSTLSEAIQLLRRWGLYEYL